jgi:ABC-type multidrug transport system ATPase subunit
VQQLVDQVVIINQGRLVRQDTLAELSGQHAGAVSVQTPSADRLLRALAAADNAASVETDRARHPAGHRHPRRPNR